MSDNSALNITIVVKQKTRQPFKEIMHVREEPAKWLPGSLDARLREYRLVERKLCMEGTQFPSVRN